MPTILVCSWATWGIGSILKADHYVTPSIHLNQSALEEQGLLLHYMEAYTHKAARSITSHYDSLPFFSLSPPSLEITANMSRCRISSTPKIMHVKSIPSSMGPRIQTRAVETTSMLQPPGLEPTIPCFQGKLFNTWQTV